MDSTNYPIYVLSKGRYKNCCTAKAFIRDKVRFYLVVEPHESAEYADRYPQATILTLPEGFYGKGAIVVRNWIWEHSKKNGFRRHWEFDDNISGIRRLNEGKRIPCNAAKAIRIVEEFTDRYTNIAISGFNYQMFVTKICRHPLQINCHVYSAMLIDNNIPFRWRLKMNGDTDLCLQVLTNNYCTVLFNAFMVDKAQTMKMNGGNTDSYKGTGRLKMARMLEAMWPQHVTVKWRFGRPQHVINKNWKCFTHPLKRRSDINWNEIEKAKPQFNLRKVKPIKSEGIKKYYDANIRKQRKAKAN